VNIKITMFCSMTCLLLLHGGRARWVDKNGDLSAAPLVLIFRSLHQVPEFCIHVVLILRFLYHIQFFPAFCLGCSFNKETLLKATGSNLVVCRPIHCLPTLCQVIYSHYAYPPVLMVCAAHFCISPTTQPGSTQCNFQEKGSVLHQS
jgi:hypothetical protein